MAMDTGAAVDLSAKEGSAVTADIVTHQSAAAAADASAYTEEQQLAAEEQQAKTLSAQRPCMFASQSLLDVRASSVSFPATAQDAAGMHFTSQAQQSAHLQSEHGLEMHCPSFKPAGQLDRLHMAPVLCASDSLEHRTAGSAGKKGTSQPAIATSRLASTSRDMHAKALLLAAQGTHANVGDGFAWQFDQSTGKVFFEFNCGMMHQNGAQIQSTFNSAAEAVKGLQAMLRVSRAPLLPLPEAASSVEVQSVLLSFGAQLS